MKKSILNLGKALNKVQQKEINGGASLDIPNHNKSICRSNTDCFNGGIVRMVCHNFYCTYEGFLD